MTPPSPHLPWALPRNKEIHLFLYNTRLTMIQTQKCVVSLPIRRSFVLKNTTDRDGSYRNKRDNNIVAKTSAAGRPAEVDAAVPSWRTRLRARRSSLGTRRVGIIRYKVGCTAAHDGWTPARVVRSCPDPRVHEVEKVSGQHHSDEPPHPSLQVPSDLLIAYTTYMLLL